MNSDPEYRTAVIPDEDAAIQKPILVFDGECAFCKYWVNRWRQRTEDDVIYIPFQQAPPSYFGISREQFRESVYLITQYRRLHGAEAVFELLAISGDTTFIRLYNLPLANRLFELGYSIVANNRNFFYELLRRFTTNP
ncbi:thiol-disulfide oxidoreductase DCC family protein [Pontibacter locisalis]|uniref:Thiol-disulfide oxidoreductase DCC family protein n=1 Tax=Pontibacter locisalis TaxID=1719035 RepID=A0ABW5II14_9BACT